LFASSVLKNYRVKISDLAECLFSVTSHTKSISLSISSWSAAYHLLLSDVFELIGTGLISYTWYKLLYLFLWWWSLSRPCPVCCGHHFPAV